LTARFNTLKQWLDWQSSLHPSEIELGLERVAGVWRKLAPDGLCCPVVTVAGTNGKGSCVAMLDAVYRQAGYRIATYTSPHLVRYNERIKLNGQAVDDPALCDAFAAVDRARGDTSLTYFEFGTLAALYLFAHHDLDLVILEVGLGGRLDAVNIIDADLALITSIDIDHTDWLGDSRDAIGREKAGIMRAGRPAVLADPAMPDSVFKEAAHIGAEVVTLGRDYLFSEEGEGWCWRGSDGEIKQLPMPGITGAGRLQNAAAVVTVCQRLSALFEISDRQLCDGLSGAYLPGRLQLVPGKPRILLDVAHNRQAVEGLAESIERVAPSARVLAVFGLLHGKDAVEVSAILGDRIDQWHLMDLPGRRGRTSTSLAHALRLGGITKAIHCWPDYPTAYEAALAAAQDQDLILVFGSFMVVGEAMHYLGIE
jgi:dihydrofolate synthase/folylpolyglutamate synthase